MNNYIPSIEHPIMGMLFLIPKFLIFPQIRVGAKYLF